MDPICLCGHPKNAKHDDVQGCFAWVVGGFCECQKFEEDEENELNRGVNG